MRTRLLRPGFWSDEVMAALPVPVRLTFMGLWGVADDAGYFDWKPRQIAAELYRYAPVKRREAQTAAHMVKLQEAGRIERLPCEVHGRIPSMDRHRFAGGRLSFVARDEHRTCASRTVRDGPGPSRMSRAGIGIGIATGSVSESGSSLRDVMPFDPKTGKYAYAKGES